MGGRGSRRAMDQSARREPRPPEKQHSSMQVKSEINRYVALTETGRDRLEAARRRFRKTLDDIAAQPVTPSINTVKKAFRRGPVFVSTIERIWDYFQQCA